MDDLLVIKASIRKRDKDILQAVTRLNLEEGEMADIVRDGFRKMLTEMGVMEVMGTRGIGKHVDPITLDIAKSIARELMHNLKVRS